MQVLIIASVWPEPASSGAGLRMMELIGLFQKQGWSICIASSAAPSPFMAKLDMPGIRRVSIELNNSSFDQFLKTVQPELVLFDRFTMEEQFGWRVERICPDAMRVIETIELHTLRQARYQRFKQSPAVIAEPTRSDLMNALALREIAALHRADLSILVSDYERDLLTTVFAVDPEQIHLCPFMFEAAQIPDTTLPFAQRSGFITIGNFRHAPNRDAVRWLKEQIWPAIHAALPEARMHVYGAYMTGKDARLQDEKTGFLMHGRADSAMAVMQQARVTLAPLRFGAGIKTKLADAMLAGTPSVATTVAAEGMHCDHSPWPGAIADDAAGFAEAAVSLYRMEIQWQQARENGFETVRTRFDATRNGDALIRRLNEINANLDEHRQRHFTGMMLRHHHQRSTEFMSRWIEAKNRLG